MKKYLLIFSFIILSINSSYCMDSSLEREVGEYNNIDIKHFKQTIEDQSTESLLLNNTQNRGEEIDRRLIEKQREKKDPPNCLILFYFCGICLGL